MFLCLWIRDFWIVRFVEIKSVKIEKVNCYFFKNLKENF